MASPASRAISAASRRPRLRPWAPIGGPRGRLRRPARCGRARRTAGVRSPAGTNCGRARPSSGREWNATASRSRRRAPSLLKPRSCSASAGAETQTMLERLPGRGTNTQGPRGVWNSVETLRCGRSMADVEGQRRLRPGRAASPQCRRPPGTASAGRRRRPRAARSGIVREAVRIATSSASMTTFSASSSKRTRLG